MIKLENGEKLALEGRKHWFIALTQIFGFFISAIIPLAVVFMSSRWDFTAEIASSGGDKLAYAAYFFCFVWALFMWMLLFINLTNYYLDVWHVTSKRLVDINQKTLFYRDEAVLRLENIQDIAIASKGIIQTLLGFGNIRVQTAGERREFIMRNIANPERVKEIIVAEQGKVKERVISVKVEEGNL